MFQLPIVFLLPPCPAYERQRLIDKNVYFVVSEKFAYLPMLLANELDGSVIIEAWKYPVVAPLNMPQEYVDPLSMVLSLLDDDDPRVEGEVERVINEMIWKD